MPVLQPDKHKYCVTRLSFYSCRRWSLNMDLRKRREQQLYWKKWQTILRDCETKFAVRKCNNMLTIGRM